MRRVSAFRRRHLPMILAVLVLLAVVVVVWIFSAPIAQWLRSAQLSDVVTFLREHLLTVTIEGGAIFGSEDSSHQEVMQCACCSIERSMHWTPKGTQKNHEGRISHGQVPKTGG